MRKVGDVTPIKVYMRDSTTGDPKTGVATPTVYYHKPGGAAVQLSTPTWSEISAANMPGFYLLTPSAGMVDTAGQLAFCVVATSCKNFNGLIEIDTNVPSDVVPLVDQVEGYVDTVESSLSSLTTAVGALPNASAIATAVWGAGSRTLSSFGTLVSDIWANATRSLTDKVGFSGTATNMVAAAPTAAQVRAEMDSSSTQLAKLDGIKTSADAAARPGAAMTLTSGERTSIANEVEAQIIDDTDSERVLTAITDKIAAVNPSLDDLTIGGIASGVRTELATELARLDVAISSRLASASYTAPDNSTITTLASRLTAVRAGLLDNLDAAITSRLAAASYTAPDNVSIEAIESAVDTEVGAIKTVIDKLALMIESDGGDYRFDANALELAPTGAGGGTGLSYEQTIAAAADALTAYDSPTKAELDVAQQAIINVMPSSVDVGASLEAYGVAKEATLTAARDALLVAMGQIDISLTDEQAAAVADAVSVAIGSNFAQDIVTEITSQMSLVDSLTIGPGVGSVRYDDIVTNTGGGIVVRAIVRAFPYNADTKVISWDDCKGSNISNDDGSYHLDLDPGTYHRRVWKNGHVVLDDTFTVNAPV